MTFECRFTILHGDFLRILHLSLCFAFDTVILISHGEVVSLTVALTFYKTLTIPSLGCIARDKYTSYP